MDVRGEYEDTLPSEVEEEDNEDVEAGENEPKKITIVT